MKKESLHEINQYEDKMFPIGMYVATRDSIIPPGRGYRDFHWHEELQITLVLRGELTIRIHTEDYILEKGEAVFFNRNLLHAITWLSEDGKYVSINFPDCLLGFFPGSRMEQEAVIPYIGGDAFKAVKLRRKNNWQRELLDLTEEVYHILERRTGRFVEYEVSARLVRFWCIFLQNMSEQMKTPSKGDIRQRERIQKMLSFIRGHYMEEIYLKEIALSANVSVGECCRSFRKFFGKSPAQYVMDYRIMKAQELLADKSREITVTEAALAVGFNDTSYFIQCFKKETGMTPGEYRNQKC